MEIPDPDRDLLDRLDRREHRKELRLAGVAAAAGLGLALAAYFLAKSLAGVSGSVAEDIAALVFIGAAVGLFAKLPR
jgi:hypothetical protein